MHKEICILRGVPSNVETIALDFISFQSQVGRFLINEAFVLHHKTSEEYPSNVNDLHPRVNDYMTFSHALVLGLEAPIFSVNKV